MRKQALYYKLGDWNADCDRCGFTYKASNLKKEWTGLRVCNECFDIRHPQDYLRGKPDRQAPPWTRPPEENPTTYGQDSEGTALTDDAGLDLLDESNEVLTDESSGGDGPFTIPDVRPEDL